MTTTSEDRLPYETPELYPVVGAPERRSAAARRVPPLAEIAGIRVDELVERFGSPLCVIDEAALRTAYRRLAAAFSARYPAVRIGYSVKTNYLSAIVALFRSEGALGEVVSGFEYDVCRDLGIPGDEIVFNGPWKSDEELRRALEDGAILHLDGDDELARVSRIAAALGGRYGVGIRVNVRLNYPPWDKFGFSLESGDAEAAARRVLADPHLRLDGLHLHLGTYVPDPAIYARGMESLVAFGLELERRHGARLRRLDIGGGYATRNRLHGTILPGIAQAPAPEDYAEAITKPLREAASRFAAPPELVLEPGRALVDEGVSMIGTVRATKRISGQKKAAVLDVGVHILPTAFWYDHEVRPVVDRGAAVESYRLVGPLCMQIDVVRETIELPALAYGDRLVIRDVGAYNFSQSMQFIAMRPAYVLLRDGIPTVVRQRETTEEVRRLERLPDHLVSAETAASIVAPRATPDGRRGGAGGD